MSLGFLIERDQPAIWRGPIVMKIITQFLRDVQWGELDYFLVDMPPGTGDAQLSLVQATKVHGAVIVTTPQEVAVGDALRGAKMFQRVAVPVLGIIENMSYFECPHCGDRTRNLRLGRRQAPRRRARRAAAGADSALSARARGRRQGRADRRRRAGVAGGEGSARGYGKTQGAAQAGTGAFLASARDGESDNPISRRTNYPRPPAAIKTY